ncbi:MAG: ribonuclease P protein component [Anaerolineales bacterium]
MLRLRSSTDFERVRREGRSYAHPLVVVIACRQLATGNDQHPASRVGYAAGKSVGTAVKRNRAKRLLRESVRSLSASIAPGWDIVLIARASIIACKAPQVRDTVAQLLKKAHVLSPPPPRS